MNLISDVLFDLITGQPQIALEVLSGIGLGYLLWLLKKRKEELSCLNSTYDHYLEECSTHYEEISKRLVAICSRLEFLQKTIDEQDKNTEKLLERLRDEMSQIKEDVVEINVLVKSHHLRNWGTDREEPE